VQLTPRTLARRDLLTEAYRREYTCARRSNEHIASAMNIGDTPMALLLMGRDEKGEPEWWIVHGTIRRDAHVVFVRSRDGAALPMEDEWLERITPVSSEHVDLFAPAAFYLPLRLGPLPEGTAAEDYVFTGFQPRT
jgi:hypothetical protein